VGVAGVDVSEADQSDTINVRSEIALEVAAAPCGLSQQELAMAGERRVESVLVVLEHNRATVCERVCERLAAALPVGTTCTAVLAFPDREPVIDAEIRLEMPDGERVDRKALARSAPEAVSSAMVAFINEQATAVGMWRPVVVSRVTDAGGVATGGAAGVRGGGGWLTWIVILVSGVCGAGLAMAYWLG
jgi:hypothetical protein